MPVSQLDGPTLKQKVTELSIKEGADLVGVSSVDRFIDAPQGHRPQDIFMDAKSVIVIAIHVSHSAFDFLPDTRLPYTIQFYSVNDRLNYISWRLTRLAEASGYRAVPIPSRGYADKSLFGLLSHKHAMLMAGLGTFGLHNLIITPQYGARVRIVSVITTADLPQDPMLSQNLCEKYRNVCNLQCIKDCPAKAISEDGYIEKFKCQQYSKGVLGKEQHGSQLMCGMCMKSCPIGRPDCSFNLSSPK